MGLMNEHRVLEDFWHLQEVRRAAAAQARASAEGRSVEPVRRVLASAYGYIAAELANEGFHPNRTGKYLYRRSDGISHRIVFTTSDANIPDQFIALYILFHVCAHRLAVWRAEHAEARTDVISHRSLADFEPGVVTVEYDLGPRTTRQAELQDALSRIRRHGLPYFGSLFHKQAVLASAEAWPSAGFATYEIRSATEFALFLGRPDIAQSLVERFFERHPELRPAYNEFASGRRLVPSAGGPDRFAWDLARVVARHGLNHPSSAA
jgi:hypothetical protein